MLSKIVETLLNSKELDIHYKSRLKLIESAKETTFVIGYEEKKLLSAFDKCFPDINYDLLYKIIGKIKTLDIELWHKDTGILLPMAEAMQIYSNYIKIMKDKNYETNNNN